MPYANPQSLVTTEWLAGHLHTPGVRVVDASWFFPSSGKTGRGEFEREHIPGAVFFDIEEIAAPHRQLPHMLPLPRRFANRVGALGLGNSNHIVIYDRVGGGSAAARAWWMFRLFGHDNVALLDGGLTKWLAEKKPVTAELIPPRDRPFVPKTRKGLVRDKEAMKANIASAAEQVVDARSRDRFAGNEVEMWPHKKVGHIPGSRNVPWNDLVAPDLKTVLPADQLERQFVDAGLDLKKPIVASCGSGVSACMLLFGLHLLGRDDVALYDGSWAEWGSVDDTPVDKGAA